MFTVVLATCSSRRHAQLHVFTCIKTDN